MNKIATVIGFFEETKGPQIQFDGEENPAEKEYPYLLSYTPKVDDKVFCLEFGESYIIIGKVNYQEEPFSLDATLEEAIKPTKDGLANLKETHEKFEKTYGEDKKQLDEKISTLDTNVTSAVNTANDASRKAQNAESVATSAKTAASNAMNRANDAYDRNSFGRFSASGPIGFFGKSRVYKRSVSTTSSTDADTLKSKINEVIQALNSYGLL